MRLVWTGKGWLALPIVVITLVVGALVAVPLSSVSALGANVGLLTIGVAFALAAFPSYLLGRALNSSVGADGRRVWHNRHQFGTSMAGVKTLQPFQLMWVGELAVAYVPLAVLVGGVLLHSPPVVWALLLLPIVAGIAAVIIVRRRRRAAAGHAVPTPAALEQIRVRSRQATQAIKAGQTLRFGGLSVSRVALELEGLMLPFADIKHIHYYGDNLYCQLQTGTHTYPLAKIEDDAVAVGVVLGLHRATTGRH